MDAMPLSGRLTVEWCDASFKVEVMYSRSCRTDSFLNYLRSQEIYVLKMFSFVSLSWIGRAGYLNPNGD
jgi:hypothetical protein